MKNCPYCHESVEEEITTCPLCNNIAQENTTEKKYIPIFSLRELLIFLGFWVFLWVAHNYLMYNLSDGVSIPLFAVLFLSSLYSVARILKIAINRNMYIVWVGIFVFSLFQSIRVGGMLTSFNTFSIYFTSLLLLTLLIKERFEDIKMGDYFEWFIKITFGSLVGSVVWLKNLMSFGIKLTGSGKNIHILKGVLMAIPLVVIFTLLFSSADIVFQTFLNNLFAFRVFDLIRAGGRLINVGFFSLAFIGLFTFVASIIRTAKKEDITVKDIVVDDKKHIEINVMLSFVSLLFLVFMLVQASYLFGSEQVILSTGHTYAEYATKGFQELSIIAIIVFFLFWKIDHYLYAHKKPSNSRIYKWLSSLIVFLTILMLFSAFHRLYLYETTYGYTEVRFYGYVFIIILWLSLLITLYKIQSFIKEGHFLISIISLYGAALLVCNVINPESFITESNTIKTYRGSLRMDSSYIWGRSEDAIDNMIKTYDTLAPDKKKEMESQFCNTLRKLGKEYSWQEFNYSKYHAWNVLSVREKEFNCTTSDYLHPGNLMETLAYKTAHGNNEVILYYEGNKYNDEWKYDLAIAKYQEWLRINDRFERLYLNLWNVYEKTWRQWEAIDLYIKGIPVCKEWCDSLNFNIWNIYFREWKYEKAIPYLDEALKKNPSHEKARQLKKGSLSMIENQIRVEQIRQNIRTANMSNSWAKNNIPPYITYPLFQTK